MRVLVEGGKPVLVQGGQSENVGVRLHVDRANASAGSHPVLFTITAQAQPGLQIQEKSSFMGMQ